MSVGSELASPAPTFGLCAYSAHWLHFVQHHVCQVIPGKGSFSADLGDSRTKPKVLWPHLELHIWCNSRRDFPAAVIIYCVLFITYYVVLCIASFLICYYLLFIMY